MEGRYEIRLAGTGGQGIILAGIILADAAIRDGKNAAQTQSYGAEARGGASRCEVVIANTEIDFPEVIQADMLLCMSQEACDRYYRSLKKDGLLLVDGSQVRRLPRTQVLGADFTTWAIEETGREIAASVLALGFLVGITHLVSQQSLEEAVIAQTPRGTAETNLKALRRGLAEAARLTV